MERKDVWALAVLFGIALFVCGLLVWAIVTFIVGKV
jgi:hypothetical protein